MTASSNWSDGVLRVRQAKAVLLHEAGVSADVRDEQLRLLDRHGAESLPHEPGRHSRRGKPATEPACLLFGREGDAPAGSSERPEPTPPFQLGTD